MDKKINRAFQGVRGYAISLIVLSHCSASVFYEGGRNLLTYAGALGVSLFIVLSGYLSARKEYDKTISLKQIWKLYVSKLKRFYPLHIITFILAIPISIEFENISLLKEAIKLLSNIFLIQSLIPNASVYFSYNAVSWYLSLTLCFIVVTPILVRKVSKWSNIKKSFFLVGVIIFEVFWCLLVWDISFNHWLIYICPGIRMLDYISGICLFYIKKEHSGKCVNISLYVAIVMDVIMLLASIVFPDNIFLVASWSIQTWIIILALAEEQNNSKIKNKIFENKLIVLIGDISFELFLIHWLLIKYASSLGIGDTVLESLIIILFTIIIAYCIKQQKNEKKIY